MRTNNNNLRLITGLLGGVGYIILIKYFVYLLNI